MGPPVLLAAQDRRRRGVSLRRQLGYVAAAPRRESRTSLPGLRLFASNQRRRSHHIPARALTDAHSDWQSIVSDIRSFGSAGKKTAVVSTINGDANVPFYKELANQGMSAEDIPVVAFSVGEEELSGIDTAPLVGHLAAWNYFMSVEAAMNDDFIDTWLDFIEDEDRVTNDPMEAHFIGFNMWIEAVKKAGTTDATAVQDAIIGVSVPNLSGGLSTMMPNHHITKPVLIGEIQDDGQFQIVWQSAGTVVGDEWSDYLEGSKDLIADWRAPLSCGNYNVKTGQCSGQNY